jgi:hypothetical protein
MESAVIARFSFRPCSTSGCDRGKSFPAARVGMLHSLRTILPGSRASAVFVLSICSAFAQEWVPTTAPTLDWNSVACSADGRKLVAVANYDSTNGSVWTSVDAGTSWVSNNVPLGDWWSVAASADASKLFATKGNPGFDGIYTSADWGKTWAKTTAPAAVWLSLASSASGTMVLAGGRRLLYASTNSGDNWAPGLVLEEITNFVFAGVASSADGTRLAVVTQAGTGASPLFISTNAGTTWTISTNVPIFWNAVGMSADGNTVIASGYYDGLFVSTNGGAIWTRTNILTVMGVAASADGSKLAAVDWSGTIRTSIDSGATWAQVTPTAPDALWASVASSADGCKLVAAVIYGQIWVSQTTPRPVLSITPSGGNLLLSWVVPSIPFVLQECSDLTTSNWTAIPTPPTLNYTNLHHEVSIPAAPARRFFRLMSR